MKIAKIHTHNMRNAEFTQFHAEFRGLVLRETPQSEFEEWEKSDYRGRTGSFTKWTGIYPE